MSKAVGDMHRLISAAEGAADSRCLYFDRDGKRCKSGAIQSHSLQRRGPLASISESGHVVKIGPTLRAKRPEDRELFERLGLAKASTFLGFCSKHDADVFDAVENRVIELTDKSALIFAIRSASLEHYRKKVMVELQKQTIAFLIESGEFGELKFYELILKGAEIAVRHGEERLRSLFSQYHRSPLTNFKFIAVKFEADAPFAITGATEPEWAMDGNFLYSIDPMKTKWNYLSIFCGNIDGRFCAFLSGAQKYRMHRIDHFLRSIKATDPALASTLFTVGVAHSENCYVKESWLSTLPRTETAKITELAASGILEGVRDPESLRLRVPIPENSISAFVTNL